MRRLGVVLATVLLALAVPRADGRAAASRDPRGNMATEHLFQTLKTLRQMKTLSARGVEKALKVKLGPEEDASNEYFEVLKGPGAAGSPFAQAELRLSRETRGRGLVVLDMAPGVRVRIEDILRRFGRSPAFSPPSAHEPPGSPSYYTYSRPGEELRFGLSDGEAKLLKVVVLDRTVKPKGPER
jgi:hypothetical protein